jgi:uncharacterized spore protein YtfJ
MTFTAGGSQGPPAFSTKSQTAIHECVAGAIAGVQLSPRAVRVWVQNAGIWD